MPQLLVVNKASRFGIVTTPKSSDLSKIILVVSLNVSPVDFLVGSHQSCNQKVNKDQREDVQKAQEEQFGILAPAVVKALEFPVPVVVDARALEVGRSLSAAVCFHQKPLLES